jgi:hypothetical protein
VSLTNVWLQTLGDGLVRADQVIGIDVHQTPALTGKPAHWLLDIVLPASTGNGTRSDWSVTALHRTLVQTSQQPGDSATVLARLLAQLDTINAAGVITTTSHRRGAGVAVAAPERAGIARGEDEQVAPGNGSVRFRFLPFPSPPPGHHTGAEYLDRAECL